MKIQKVLDPAQEAWLAAAKAMPHPSKEFQQVIKAVESGAGSKFIESAMTPEQREAFQSANAKARAFYEHQQATIDRVVKLMRTDDSPSISRAPLPRWTGTKRALGDKAREMYASGQIKAKSADDAIHVLCKSYVDRHGNPIKPKSIIDSLRIRKTIEGK